MSAVPEFPLFRVRGLADREFHGKTHFEVIVSESRGAN